MFDTLVFTHKSTQVWP